MIRNFDPDPRDIFFRSFFGAILPLRRAGRAEKWSFIKIKNEIRFFHAENFLSAELCYPINLSGKLKKSIFWPFLAIFPSPTPLEPKNIAWIKIATNQKNASNLPSIHPKRRHLKWLPCNFIGFFEIFNHPSHTCFSDLF